MLRLSEDDRVDSLDDDIDDSGIAMWPLSEHADGWWTAEYAGYIEKLLTEPYMALLTSLPLLHVVDGSALSSESTNGQEPQK
jgi:hypothetical protein